MEVSKFIGVLDEIKKTLQDDKLITQRVNLVAGNFLVGSIKKRIFLNGMASNDTPIGAYSKEPYYQSLNAKNLIALPSGGKSKPNLTGLGNFMYGTSKGNRYQLPPKVIAQRVSPNFANGKKRRSMWLPLGYYQFRQLVGRQGGKVQGAVTTDGVNLNLTGSLNQAFSMHIEGKKLILSFKDALSEKIAEGQEKKYGKEIFKPSEKESQRFEEMALNEINRIVQSIISKTYGNRTS